MVQAKTNYWGQLIEKAEDVIKNPYVLEFLGIPQDYEYSEKAVEQIIDRERNGLKGAKK